MADARDGQNSPPDCAEADPSLESNSQDQHRNPHVKSCNCILAMLYICLFICSVVVGCVIALYCMRHVEALNDTAALEAEQDILFFYLNVEKRQGMLYDLRTKTYIVDQDQRQKSPMDYIDTCAKGTEDKSIFEYEL